MQMLKPDRDQVKAPDSLLRYTTGILWFALWHQGWLRKVRKWHLEISKGFFYSQGCLLGGFLFVFHFLQHSTKASTRHSGRGIERKSKTKWNTRNNAEKPRLLTMKNACFWIKTYLKYLDTPKENREPDFGVQTSKLLDLRTFFYPSFLEFVKMFPSLILALPHLVQRQGIKWEGRGETSVLLGKRLFS